MRACVMTLVVFLLSGGVGITAENCLHGRSEPPSEGLRRREALKVAHQIHLAQRMQKRFGGRYRPLNELGNVSPAPVGFSVQLLTDGAAYAFWITDTQNSCAYTIFGHDSGRIYQAHPSAEPVLLPVTTRS